MAEQELAVSVCFGVKIDDRNLGDFTSVEGLGCEIKVEPVFEGGNNNFQWQLPTRMTYTNVKLSRPLTADTVKVAEWFTSIGKGVKPTSATVTARDPEGKVLLTFSLAGVIPIRWSGPSLNVDTSKVATETIEIAHHGLTTKVGE